LILGQLLLLRVDTVRAAQLGHNSAVVVYVAGRGSQVDRPRRLVNGRHYNARLGLLHFFVVELRHCWLHVTWVALLLHVVIVRSIVGLLLRHLLLGHLLLMVERGLLGHRQVVLVVLIVTV
jgi:hypothetical protein